VVFLLGVTAWVYVVVDSPIELLWAIAAIVVRAGYLRREIILYRFYAVAVALLALVAPLFVPVFHTLVPGPGGSTYPPLQQLLQDSALFAGRMFVTVIAMLNASGDPSLAGVGQILVRPFAAAGVLAQLIAQYPGEVARRTSEVVYAARMRTRRQSNQSWGRVRLIRNTALAVAIDMASMSNQIAVIVASRGTMPRIGLWKTVPKGTGTVVIADIVFLAVASVLVLATKAATRAGML
jgi:hypothetical protein